MPRRPAPLLTLFALLLAALVVAACGGGEGTAEEGDHPDYARALRGAPAPLAALHAQAGELLPGGTDAFERRLRELRGYPVVVNVWASWCGPCRFEFPLLQEASARYGKRVAFLGVDAEDDADAARTFLASEPVPYPSFSDDDRAITRSLGATVGLPDTAFFDRRGELVYLKQGPYTDEAEFEADLRRYALGAPG